MELHLNEYNSFTIDYPRGGLQDSPLLAAAFAADLDTLLADPSLTRVSWAQFLDSGNDNYSGMIGIDGEVKPLYRAYEFYQSMPVDRREVRVEGPEGVGALASADEGSAAVLVWNRSITDVTVSIAAGRDDLNVVVLDSSADHRSRALADGMLHLERGAVALVSSASARPKATPRMVSRTRIRVDDRHSRSWTDVDEATATVRFGTADAAGITLHAGLDLPADRAGTFRTSVTTADLLEDSTADGVRTVWATLSGAPAHAFGRVEFVPESRA